MRPLMAVVTNQERSRLAGLLAQARSQRVPAPVFLHLPLLDADVLVTGHGGAILPVLARARARGRVLAKARIEVMGAGAAGA